MIDAVRAFAAVAAEGSMASAARRVGQDEAALGEQIRALEARYGLPLVEHVGNEARLTAGGQKLYEHCGRVLAAIEDLERDLRALREGTAGLLEVATSPIPGEAVLPLLLPRFQQLQPAVQVRESVGDTRSVAERLLRREVEVAIVGGPFYDDRLEAHFFARDELALIARRDHPLAGRGPLRAVEVCRYPLVLRSEGSGARTAVEAALLAAGVERASIRVAAELGSTEAVKRAVEAGLGVAFVSICALAQAGPAGELRILPLAEAPPARDLLVLTKRGRARTALAEAFYTFLLSDETLRQVARFTRLPARLRPAPTGPHFEGPKASPAAGLEADPLLPPITPGGPAYRLARPPRTPDEARVARALAAVPDGRRAALLERLADELRRADGDALAAAPEVGLYRLELYQEEAAALLDNLVGDLLAEGLTQAD